MLYKLTASSTDGKLDNLEPTEFTDFAGIGGVEKDLEDLLAKNLLGVLFEDARYMPIQQSRKRQEEADIYALDEKGDLVIFELKRATVDKYAVHQILRYAELAGQWDYAELQGKWHEYTKLNTSKNGNDSEQIDEDALAKAHNEAFGTKRNLSTEEFNTNQHLIIVGSAADVGLIEAVDYWKMQGLSIQFLPYRVYKFKKEKYFEFFSAPYDKHQNPADIKGVLFDTNRSYDENDIWYMLENKRVAAFGDSSRFVRQVSSGDTVFFSHKGVGLVAVAKVKKGGVKSDEVDDSRYLYQDVDFLIDPPLKGSELPAMPFYKVSEFLLGKRFFWARTIKVPYLTKDESDNLVEELKKYLEVKK